MPHSSPEAPPAIYAQAWAVKLGAVLIAALTLILGLAFFDSAHRKDLESVSETTAVGDSHYFQAPTDATRLPAVGATLNGQPLYVADVSPLEIRDTHLHRVGHDSASGLAIYELAPTATDLERQRVGTKQRAFLLKFGVNQFVICRPSDAK